MTANQLQGSAAGPQARDLYILLHLYKTAGQTLNEQLKLNFRRPEALQLYVGPMGLDISKFSGSPANPGWVTERVREYVARGLKPQTRVAYGHMAYYGMHTLAAWPVTPRYVAFLRDPIERVISLYYYLRDKSENFWHQEIVEAQWDLETWLENSRALWQHNGQTRQLLIGSDDTVSTQRELSQAQLERAKQHLREFWFVGFTETFRADAFFLYSQLGLRRYHADEQVNANASKPTVTTEVRHTIAKFNTVDSELYAYAQELKAAWLRTHQWEYRAHQYRAHFWRFVDRLRTRPHSGSKRAGSVGQR
jgi:hypothetical protein